MMILLQSNDIPMGRKLPDVFIQTDTDTAKYENQGANHSTYMILKDDVSFVYYTINNDDFELTLGDYTRENDTITFNWNEEQTTNAVQDANIYYFYYMHGVPKPSPIINIRYHAVDKSLQLIDP
ncbi:MAG: hypothetical protein IH948_06905 [Bacteroidetes bacterium]|nr:hypothetical protein [Bacteroidota bacterium]